MSIAEKFEVIADEVYEKGKKDEWGKFWDTIQDYGNRADYQRAFYDWNCDYIRPKYKVVPTAVGSLGQMFRNSKIKKIEAEYFDLSQVPIGTSSTQGNYYTFAYCEHLEEIEDIGFQPNRSYNNCFQYCYALKTIAKLRSDESITWSEAFRMCRALENLTIEGTIGQNGFNVQWSTKLSSASIVSIIEALSTTTSGLTVTLSQTAVDNMTFPITGNKGTYNSWTELEQSKTNWTISLL